MLLRLPFEALTDDRVPADLLTTLVGGRLRLTADAARRLLDGRGARLRTVVVDGDGTVLGVGRSTRQPPGWLRDVLAAVHDTCTGPRCDRPARGAHLDHATPWWPTRPGDPAGATDIDNLGPLCAGTNRAKEATGWQVTQTTATASTRPDDAVLNPLDRRTVRDHPPRVAVHRACPSGSTTSPENRRVRCRRRRGGASDRDHEGVRRVGLRRGWAAAQEGLPG